MAEVPAEATEAEPEAEMAAAMAAEWAGSRVAWWAAER
jgi:hypothetical protein